jgi:hypothetical protein
MAIRRLAFVFVVLCEAFTGNNYRGQVAFTLVVRDNGDPTGDLELWIAPYLYRKP